MPLLYRTLPNPSVLMADASLLTLTVRTALETAQVGKGLGLIAQPGDVILLDGDLGAGKTTLTQAIALGLSVSEEQYVTSPSFGLMHEYLGRIPLYHMDFYRLAGEDDIEGAGLMDYIGGPGLAVIEWPDRLGSLRPHDRLDVTLTILNETERRFVFTPRGAGWQARMEQLRTTLKQQGA